jgi:DNA-binding beta-propeller fold protein YncE
LDRPGVQIFDSNGKFLGKWGSIGTGDGQFSLPQEHISVDSKDRIYIVDGASNPRIQIFDAQGHLLGKFGSFGTGDGQLKKPEHLTIDSKGYLYVVDRGNQRMQVFAPVNNTSK